MKYFKVNFECFYIELSILYYKYFLYISSEYVWGIILYGIFWVSMCKLCVLCVIFREVVNVKSVCVCDNRKFIGILDFFKEDEGLEFKEVGIWNSSLFIVMLSIVYKVFFEKVFVWL